jgi:hypothetical protein
MRNEEDNLHEQMEAPEYERAEAESEGVLGALEELTPEELEALEEMAVAAKQQEEELREKLSQVLVKHRDDAVKFRVASGIEQQWAEDQAYYEGEDDSPKTLYYKGLTQDSPLIAKPKSKYRSRVFLNITRPYVETAASKVIEVLSPVDDRAWSLEPTSIPNLPEKPSPIVQALQMAQEPQPQEQQIDPATGQPVQAPAPAEPPPDPYEEALAIAKRACKGAQIWIDDKLQECDFSTSLRAVVDAASRLGTGIMRGPVPQLRRTVKMVRDQNTGEDVVEVLEELVPASKDISCWDAYPDPACGDNIHNGQFFIEHDQFVEKQVRDLIGQPGYIDEAIAKVIEQGPVCSATDTMSAAPHDSQDMAAKRFHVWYYYGFLTREEVLALQCSCSEADVIANVGVPVVVTMINDTPVKAHLNQATDGRFPYDFMCWQRVAGSPWGIGISRQIRSCQAILNSHVRAMMENAGLSSGPQIFLSRGSIIPADGSWEITPRKVWLIKPDADVQDVSQAMGSVIIPSIQAELLQAIEFALKMAENVTGLPILLQGQQGPSGVPETVGGMQILVANASSLLRRMARIFDDYLIKPHIQAYYTYLMTYADDPSIKGDFKVVARGSSALVARDQRNMFLTQVAPQMMANPSFGIDPTRLFKQIANVAGLSNPEEIMFSPEEMAAMQKAQEAALAKDPKIQVATLNNQTRIQVAEMQNQTDQMRVQRDTDRDSVYVALETQRTQVTAATKREELELRRELALLDYANKNQITLDKIKAQLAIESGRHDLQRELATLPTPDEIAATVRGENIASNPRPQVATPAVEPPGKAPDGQAFAR